MCIPLPQWKPTESPLLPALVFVIKRKRKKNNRYVRWERWVILRARIIQRCGIKFCRPSRIKAEKIDPERWKIDVFPTRLIEFVNYLQYIVCTHHVTCNNHRLNKVVENFERWVFSLEKNYKENSQSLRKKKKEKLERELRLLASNFPRNWENSYRTTNVSNVLQNKFSLSLSLSLLEIRREKSNRNFNF